MLVKVFFHEKSRRKHNINKNHINNIFDKYRKNEDLLVYMKLASNLLRRRNYVKSVNLQFEMGQAIYNNRLKI